MTSTSLSNQDYALITRAFRQLTNIDLSSYKDQQMRRRLASYVAIRRITIPEFCERMAKHPEELRQIRAFITINVSEFFRDAAQFKLLRERILPQLLTAKARLNIWSAGCSIGAEAYSIAMLLEQLAPGGKHRILATDIDLGVLAQAKAGGPYSAADLRGTATPLVTKYFTPAGSEWFINTTLLSPIEFRVHNLLQDPYEQGLDLIVCRNVIIYFNDDAKNRVMGSFARALSREGVLFIGATDSLLNGAALGLRSVSSCFFQRETFRHAAMPAA